MTNQTPPGPGDRLLSDSNVTSLRRRLAGLRERVEDGSGAGTALEEPESRRPHHLIRIGAASLVMMLFGAAMWFVYQAGADGTAAVPPPTVRADRSPLKVPPDDPGGLQVADQDRLIFDSLTPEVENYEEQILPPPEEPLDMDEVFPEAAAEPVIPEPVSPAPAAPPQVAAARPVVPSRVESEPAPVSEPATEGSFTVQIAALGSADAARNAWRDARESYPVLLGNRNSRIQSVERDGTTFHRLQTGNFATREAADRLCQALKALGQDCLVVAREG